MGVVIPLQRDRHLTRASRQLRLAYPARTPGAALRACLEEVRREDPPARATMLWPPRRSPQDPPDAA